MTTRMACLINRIVTLRATQAADGVHQGLAFTGFIPALGLSEKQPRPSRARAISSRRWSP